MLADKELEQATRRLAEFRTANADHHETLSDVLEKYTTLVDEYKRLKSDYEEERDSRERYKQMAKGQERNPFVLVLIDGDGYVFDDDLISSGVEGGQKAAQLLNDTVKHSLRSLGLEHCRIMVRVYANLVGLSKVLSKIKLAGPEKRSLAPFTASFTRSNDLFDFVDAGELKENADFKIRALFRQFVENAQCKHIYFAGCHDVGYLSELTQYVGHRDRITLVRTAAFHHEFNKLGLRVEDFPNIFRGLPLDIQATGAPVKPSSTTRMSEPSSSNENTITVCPFFQKGVCKYGKVCRNLHVKVNANGGYTSSETGSLAEIRDWRHGGGSKYTMPFQMPSGSKHDSEYMNGNNVVTDPAQLQKDFESALPHSIPPNEVAVNKHDQRLDEYIPQPTPQDRAIFHERISHQKLCNKHHINGNCPNDNCEYDHNPVSLGVLNCLKQMARSNPCPHRGGCRKEGCLYGHICHKVDCQKRGGKQYCKFSPLMHNVPLEVSEYVPATRSKEAEPNHAFSEMNSIKSTTPPLQEGADMQVESDGEPNREEGALLDFSDDAAID